MKETLFGGYPLDITIVERNYDGSIKSVRYAEDDREIPVSADEFFNNTLKKRETDDFVMSQIKDSKYGMRFERYQQYYHGVIVEDGHYNFRFKHGKMRVVKGHYVHFSGIETKPSITEKEAVELYASYLGIGSRDIIKPYVDLMIKEIPDAADKEVKVTLTYRVFLYTVNAGKSYVGYIDAHTGKLLYKEDAFIDYSTTGQFYTYYNRNLNDAPKSGITDYTDNQYLLKDNTRGYGISTYKQNPDGTSGYCTDNDNTWTRQELGNQNIALDVHWTMEQIYDLMDSLFAYDGFDGSGHQIESIIFSDNYYGNNAFFAHPGDYFGFGTAPNNSVFGPLASVDVIGHEFGHAVLFNTAQLVAGSSGDPRRAIHEGLADIWGIIFENHITPNSDCWMSGEQIMINNNSCMRNFQNPNDMTAYTQISSTCGCGAYYSSDPHIAGGLLPYWFYLLVNGGIGTNGYYNNYQLIPVGFDLAEDLFQTVTLTPAYLEDCTTFQEVREAFVDAAEEMENDFLSEQVQNAWYAVGLYSEPVHIHCQSYAPGTATYYVYGNSNCLVNWSLTNLYGSLPTLVPNSNNHSCTVYTTSSFSGDLNATIYCDGTTVTYSRYISGAASPSNSGYEVLQVTPLDGSHYLLSIDLGSEDNNVRGIVKAYDAMNNQLKTSEEMENGSYVLDTSSWGHGLYIIEMTVKNKKHITKITK